MKTIWFDIDYTYADAFEALHPGTLVRTSLVDLIADFREATETGVPIDLLSIGRIKPDTSDLVTYLALTPTPITLINFHLKQRHLALTYSLTLRQLGYKVTTLRAGIDFLVPDEKSCPRC